MEIENVISWEHGLFYLKKYHYFIKKYLIQVFIQPLSMHMKVICLQYFEVRDSLVNFIFGPR